MGDKNDTFEDDEVDPRVKGELDILNQSTDEINSVENKLSEHRAKFEAALTNATQRLDKLTKKYRKSIERARPYYVIKQEVDKAHFALQRAVNNYQRANGVHRAAKETILLAETRLSEFGHKKVDSAWQEMLNAQTIRFTEAERDRTRSEGLHRQAAKKYEFLQKKLQAIGKRHKRSTVKAKPYFLVKETVELELQKKRHKVEELQRSLDSAKKRYRLSLDNLERISTEIHQKRRQEDIENRKKMGFSENRIQINGADEELVKSLQLDLIGPQSYENINDLEEELKNFQINDYNNEDEYSTSESESDYDDGDSTTSESSASSKNSSQSSHVFNKRSVSSPHKRRHNVRNNYPNLARSASVDVNMTQSTKKMNRKLLSVDEAVFESVIDLEKTMTVAEVQPILEVSTETAETEELFCKDSFKASEEESTYHRLHGTNVDSELLPASREKDDFDIFEDLC